jgi:dihydrofolate reductase
MQLTSTIFVSVDGVYQGPGGPTEDTSNGFTRGGWLTPHFDEDTGKFITEVFDQADAFLLGRRTYDIFAGYWPKVTDPNDPVASPLNGLPKYVASTTLKDPEWAKTTVLDGDVAEAVHKLKEQQGRELQVHGSGQLVRFLLDNDLVDRLNLLTFPVIVGAGRRLFPESGIATGLAVESARTTGSGVTIALYRPTGRAEFGEVPGIEEGSVSR